MLKICCEHLLIIYKNYKYKQLLYNSKHITIFMKTINISSWHVGLKYFNNIPNYLKIIVNKYSTFYEYKYLPSSITKLYLNEELRLGQIATDQFFNSRRRKIYICNLPNKIKNIGFENIVI